MQLLDLTQPQRSLAERRLKLQLINERSRVLIEGEGTYFEAEEVAKTVEKLTQAAKITQYFPR